jgi:outer membrane protein assembly factor BamE (lipoprotein component of BamABCDE complex)
MKRSFIVSLVASALICLPGCASDKGQKTEPAKKPEQVKKEEKPKDSRPMEQRLSVGMTKDEVRKAIGNPKDMSMNSNGSESWNYSDSEKVFIPHYTMFGGKIHFLTVNFDKDGKVTSWSSSAKGMY